MWSSCIISGVKISTDIFNVEKLNDIQTLDYCDLGHDLLCYIFEICDYKGQLPAVKFLALQIVQRYLKVVNYELKTQPLQLFAMCSILIASKLLMEEPLQVKKLHKFAAYKFSTSDVVKAEVKMVTTLDYSTDFTYCSDDVYTRVMVNLQLLKPILLPGDQESGHLCAVDWAKDICEQLLDLVVFNHGLVSTFTATELSAGVVQAAISVMTRNYSSLQTPVTARLTSFWQNEKLQRVRLDNARIQQVAQAIMKFTLGKHIFNQLK